MPPRSARAAFTLLELLLVVVLLVVFATAAVLNLTPLWRGAQLDEGAGQLESLLRFARAEAAQQGRRVQFQAHPAGVASDGVTPEASSVRLSWEPEPLTQPGVFVASASAATLAHSLSELVRIEKVRRVEPLTSPVAADAMPPSTGADPNVAAAATDPTAAASDTLAPPGSDAWPPIMFYPDGSSDSAEILVASLRAPDPRRLLVRWNGLSGTATRSAADPEALDALAAGAAAAQPLEPSSVARSAMGELAP